MPGLWIEYHAKLRDFWKVKRLSDRLQIPYAHALGLVSCLWTWAADNKPDGKLDKFTDSELAEAAKWTGEINGFVRYQKECELMDADGRIHDWEQHGIRVLEESRRKQQAYRDRKKAMKATRRHAAHVRWQRTKSRA